jgi:pyruvate dehydrogenase E2 component (dihydrolipoamide acetyltransferase)
VSTDPKPFGVQLPPWPQVDFAAFGPIESRPLSRVQKLVSGYMARNWVMIPHVTHHDEADITTLDAALSKVKAAHPNVRITPLGFFVKAVVAALKQYPQLNASLDATGGTLILKKYFNIGIAVDTPGGLLVPVIRDCDKKPLAAIAGEIAALSQKAREKGLPMTDMVGGCFTISSLGAIGGTAFTPIINAPEVAILGVAKAQWKPQRSTDGGIDWRLMLPLSLSYDHRVINGADAARFTVAIAGSLAEPSALADLDRI